VNPRFKLYHPLWIHIPAALLIVIYGTAFIWHMVIIKHEARWYDVPLYLFYPLLILGFSVFVDEFWAVSETGERFNWISLLDEFFIALPHTDTDLGISSWVVMLLIVASVGMAAVLEIRRPHQPKVNDFSVENVTVYQAMLVEQFKSGQSVAYWEKHKIPIYFWFLLLLWGGAASTGIGSWDNKDRFLIVFWAVIFLGILGFFLWDRRFISVNRERLLASGGPIYQRLLRLEPLAITDIDILEVTGVKVPADCLHYGDDSRNFFVEDQKFRYVKITDSNNETYLIASRHPDRLAAAIRAMKEAAEGSQETGEATG
jgi:hypothetical protein